jgi:putative ABC transport system permease protein
MLYKKYILTTYRLLTGKWWLSLTKLISLTMGILSFLLVWLFYIDHQNAFGDRVSFAHSCNTENVLILGSIIMITITIYFLIMKSQMTFRYREFFIRKLYGESWMGIISILLVETAIFIVSSFTLSLVLIDQVAPFFNLITDREIDTTHIGSETGFLVLLGFFLMLGFITGLVPAIICAQKNAVDLMKKLP